MCLAKVAKEPYLNPHIWFHILFDHNWQLLADFIAMAKLLPVKPVERLEKDKVKQLAALIKGCIPDCKLEDFPADPEKACKRLQTFLCLWYPSTSNKKADERKAFSEACGRLETHETKAVVNNLHEYKAWLLRKKEIWRLVKEQTQPSWPCSMQSCKRITRESI